jgi:hypothetical protein
MTLNLHETAVPSEHARSGRVSVAGVPAAVRVVLVVVVVGRDYYFVGA